MSTQENPVAATVRMFSGCQDDQTSADVSNVANFELPADVGPGGAGGACTSAMIRVLHDEQKDTWVSVLSSMRDYLQGAGYTQIPQLSCSRQDNLKGAFSVTNPESNGNFRALLIGINYVGASQGQLSGCHNDVYTMKDFLFNRGYSADTTRLVLDDSAGDALGEMEPTYDNIIQSFRWLVDGAQAGDSLFMHYSGHGGSMRDTSGDEADGMDETMVPVDYATAGQMPDDIVFKELVQPLPAGCQLTVVMDCCHSGSILDLPYNFKATQENIANIESGGDSNMQPNPKFEKLAMKIGMDIAKAIWGGKGAMEAIQQGGAQFLAEGGAGAAMDFVKGDGKDGEDGKKADSGACCTIL